MTVNEDDFWAELDDTDDDPWPELDAGPFEHGARSDRDVLASLRLYSGLEWYGYAQAYLESKEQLSGFYIFECGTLDEALGWAARVPDASSGVIEVRPLFSLE